MGQPENSKIIVVIIFLLVTISFFGFYSRPVPSSSANMPALTNSLGDFKGWRKEHDFTLSQKIVSALCLDDYLYRNYSNGAADIVSLYIGYYRTAKKVGAAHDPTVCFPGQGWLLRDQRIGCFQVDIAGKKTDLEFSSMIAERNGQRELLVYWFQAGKRATPSTLSQKISLLRSRFVNGCENNAFVRISISLDGMSKEKALQKLYSFVEVFYPAFHSYIIHNGNR